MISQVAIGYTKRTVIKPTEITGSVWIDASDYAVGTFSDGTVLTNKLNPAIVFEVEGTTLAIQVNANGKKEFVFDGSSYIKCTSGVSDFTKYKNGLQNYTVSFIGKIGTTSNPDAVYGICGNSPTTSLAHGFWIQADNRTATPVGSRGFRYAICKNVGSSFPVNSFYSTQAVYNSRRSHYFTFDITNAVIDNLRLFAGGDMVGLTDRIRSTAHTTSGLGSIIVFATDAPTYAFEIGATGNGGVQKLTGKMEQFMIFDVALTKTQVRGIDEYFQMHNTYGNSIFQYVDHQTTLNDQYIFGGMYAKKANKTLNVFLSSRGSAHDMTSTQRPAVQLTTTDNRPKFTLPYTNVFSTSGESVHMGPSGGYTPTGRLITVYGKFTTSGGAWNSLICRYSDNDGTTWSSEINITVPTTSPALDSVIAHDKLVVCNNGDIALPVYAASGTSLYKIYVLRSSDDGLSWTFTEVYSSGSAYVNESSFAHCGGNNWIVASRVEAINGSSFEYKIFRSTDDLATFSDLGNINLNHTLYVYAHPPQVRDILIDGTRVIELSFVNRGTRRWHFCYITASGFVSNGISEFTGKTVYVFDIRLQGTTAPLSWRTGYPFLIHPNNDLHMEGVWFHEEDENNTHLGVFRVDDELKGKIKTELGI